MEKIIIEPSRGWRHINSDEIWRFRELLYFFTWRDLKVRYRQTVIGVLWALIQPLLTMIVFSVFFGRYAGVQSEGVPYPIFVYVGLLPWTLFSQSLARSSASVVSNSHLIKKIYFPRLITPLAAAMSSVIDFLIGFVILFFMMTVYKVPYTAGWLSLPFLILITFVCSVGLGFWLSAINTLYRDIQYIIPFAIQIGLFLTPVIYPVSIVTDKYAWLLYLNPMAGIIETYRALLLGYKSVPVFGLVLSVAVSLLFFISGIFFFRRMERIFADVV